MLGNVIADTFQTIGFSESSKLKFASSVDKMTSEATVRVEALGRNKSYVLISICANLNPLESRSGG